MRLLPTHRKQTRHYRHLLTLFSLVLFVLGACALPSKSVTSTRSVTFEKEYKYRASDADSKLSSRAIASAQVKRLLLEELGTYLEVETEVRKFELTKDQITTLAAAIVQTEIVDDRWDGKKYWLKARITADPDTVAKSIDILRKDRQKSEELEEVKNKADQAMGEIAALRKELSSADKELPNQEPETSKLKRYQEAVNVLSATDWFKIGVAFLRANNEEKAVESFSKAIDLDPGFTQAYAALGAAYDKRGQYDKAIDSCNEALEIDPINATAYNNRGIAFRNKGQHDKAIADYDKALEIDPNFAESYNGRGNVYVSTGEYDKAIADYNKALEINPGYVKAYADRGTTYGHKGQYDKAIADLKKALELNPNYAIAYNNRGLIYAKKGQLDKAIADYDKALELNRNYANAYANRGLSYANKGEYAKAIEDFSKAIDLDHDLAFAYHNRGAVYLKKGEYDKAIPDLKIAAKLGYKKAQSYLKSKGIDW